MDKEGTEMDAEWHEGKRIKIPNQNVQVNDDEKNVFYDGFNTFL